jgi:hypothetical protein
MTAPVSRKRQLTDYITRLAIDIAARSPSITPAQWLSIFGATPEDLKSAKKIQMSFWQELGLIISNEPALRGLPLDTLDKELDEVIRLRTNENESFKPNKYTRQNFLDNYNRHAKSISVLRDFQRNIQLGKVRHKYSTTSLLDYVKPGRRSPRPKSTLRSENSQNNEAGVQEPILSEVDPDGAYMSDTRMRWIPEHLKTSRFGSRAFKILSNMCRTNGTGREWLFPRSFGHDDRFHLLLDPTGHHPGRSQGRPSSYPCNRLF